MTGPIRQNKPLEGWGALPSPRPIAPRPIAPRPPSNLTRPFGGAFPPTDSSAMSASIMNGLLRPPHFHIHRSDIPPSQVVQTPHVYSETSSSHQLKDDTDVKPDMTGPNKPKRSARVHTMAKTEFSRKRSKRSDSSEIETSRVLKASKVKTTLLDPKSKLRKLPPKFRLTEAVCDNLIIKRNVESEVRSLPKSEIPTELPFIPAAVNSKIIEFGIPKGISVNKINDVMEYGIFAQKHIQKNDIIGVYAGVFRLGKAFQYNDDYSVDALVDFKLSEADAKALFGADHHYTDGDDYVLQVDATNMGNFTRYINHATASNANVKIALCMVNGSLQVALQAQKNIKPGEQLLYNYGPQYWERKGIVPEIVTPQTYMYLDSSSQNKKMRTS